MRPLTICGPGGPFAPIRECGAAFARSGGGRVDVLKSEPALWRSLWEKGVDAFYGGAPYMLDDFKEENPDILDLATLQELWPRAIGILVRSGNPLRIASLVDLGRRSAKVLDVQLERMGTFQAESSSGGFVAALSVRTGEEGRQAWVAQPHLDAWITYRTWHVALGDASEFLPLGDRADATRCAVVALCRDVRHDEAQSFVKYLQSVEAHVIFRRHGWD